ncbi:MAG: outer membrane beta-barrel protein [Prevotellaceae bacterium]|jgi:hypothetical protein|nr:outer membrane beta-barrel protein [Prevotellaceae bacterium]
MKHKQPYFCLPKVALLLLCFACSWAARAEISLGARYGAGLTTVYFAPFQNETMEATSANFGLAFRYCNREATDYDRNMNFIVEFGYADRRYSFNPQTSSSAQRPLLPLSPGEVGILGKLATVKAQALEMPLMMQYKLALSQSENVNILITGIAYGAYYLKTRVSYLMDEVPKTTYIPRSSLHFQGFEYGVGGGLGFSLRRGNFDYALDARYTASMSYLYKPNLPPDVYESMPMQVIFSFSLMYKIR